MPPEVTAQKVHAVILRDKAGAMVGLIARTDKHWVFHSVSEMTDDDICDLFPEAGMPVKKDE